MRLHVGAASSVGRVRETNEDAYLVRADQGLFVVCDGMGGAAAGEVASGLAVETIAAHAVDDGIGKGIDGGFQPRTVGLCRAVLAANRAILDRATQDPSHAGMGTTVVGVWVADGLASIAHVGDSRAYISHHDGFESLTRDHSLVEAQVQAGLINREQSLRSEHQNVLLRALGREPDVQVEINETAVAAGDQILLCTDGLTRMVTDDGLAEALGRFRGDPQGACDHLIETANANGGPDNITVIVVEFPGARLTTLFDRLRRSTSVKAPVDK
jgi:serine/threonine protein phosphatase PrpC